MARLRLQMASQESFGRGAPELERLHLQPALAVLPCQGMSKRPTVAALLKAAGFSRRAFEAATGISTSTIWRMSTGTEPHNSTITAVAAALSVTPDELRQAIAASRKRAAVAS